MRRVLSICLLLALSALAWGCGGRYSVVYRDRGDDPHHEEAPAKNSVAVHSLHIPPGHLPPPGSCRIWVPGVPPGRQSRPGRCEDLARRVPAGALLLTRSKHEPKYVEVTHFDQHRPGLVIDVEIYLAATGEFVGYRKAR